MWHKFAPSLDRGQRIHGSVDGRFVTAIRLANGRLKCIDTTCYHAGGPLGIGPIEELNGESCITCPWHSYQVSLEDGGKFYQALEMDKATKKLLPAGWKKKERAQRVHEIEDRNGEVWVRLNQNPLKYDSDDYSTSAICADRARMGDFAGPKTGKAGTMPGLMSSGQLFQEQRWRPCKVLSVEKEGTEGIRMKVLAGSDFRPKPYPTLMLNAAELFSHSYVAVRVGSVQRFYTPLVSFGPVDDENVLTFSIRVYPKSTVAASLARLRAGDMLDVRKASETDPPSAKTEGLAAESFLPQKFRRALLIAGGSGVSPLLAVAKSILENTPDTLITFLCFNRFPETALCRDELSAAAAKYPKRIILAFAYSHKPQEPQRPADALTSFGQKVDAKFITRFVSPKLAPNEEKILISWCGPSGFMDATQEQLLAAGFHESSCFFVPFVG